MFQVRITGDSMETVLLSRRGVALGLAALPLSGVAGVRAARAEQSPGDAAAPAEGLSSSCESIYHERQFAARPVEVYEALTNAAKFDAVTRLSDAVTLVTAPHAQRTSISPAV